MQFTITLAIIVVTALVSFGAFNNQKLQDDLIFYAPAIKNQNQWYRFITHGLLHGDMFHLVFNMYSFYSFGTNLEVYSFGALFGPAGKWIFLLLYLSALVVASLPDYFKHKDSYGFRSLGASGAVSAVIFASIVLMPGGEIGIFFLPVGIPSYIYGVVFLAISAYMDRRGGSNVNHGAHLWGAIYGLVFTIAFVKGFSDFDLWDNFLRQVRFR